MLLFRSRFKLRVATWFVVLLTSPLFLGLDNIYRGLAVAASYDPESSPYETAYDSSLFALAESRHFSALELAEWVRREIEYEPYSGSVKGALGTYYSRSGNDVDHALLLGTLLDLSNKKWRLAVGNARLSLADAEAWLGVSSPGQVADLLSKGRVKYHFLGNPGAPEWLVLEDHVWLEIWVDYFPMREAAADDRTTGVLGQFPDAAERWVPFDPSVTFRQAPTETALASILGVNSTETLQRIRQRSQITDEGNGVFGVRQLPDSMIKSTAIKAGRSLGTFLKNEATSLAGYLKRPGSLLQPERQGLPGNLPYEILGNVKRIGSGEPAELVSFLSDIRKRATISLYSAESGGVRVATARLGLPRFGQHRIAVHFVQADNTDLTTAVNSPTYALGSPVRMRPAIRMDGADLLEPGNLQTEVPLGRELWLELQRDGVTHPRVRILCGGYYVLDAFPALNQERSTLIQADLNRIGQNPSRTETLNAYLDLAGHSALLETQGFNRLALGALGYRPVMGDQCLLAGIEPTLVGTVLSSPSLVVHLFDGGNRRVPRLATPLASLDEAETLYHLINDVALTASMEALAGNDGFQSASRLMVVCNSSSGTVRTATQGSGASLAARVPASIPGLSGEMENRLRQTHLVLLDEDLLGSPIVGRQGQKADWGYFEIENSGGRSQTVAAQGACRSARVPLPLALACPLDTIVDAPAARYQALLARATRWNEQVIGVSDLMATGIAGAAGVVYDWLDVRTGPPDPVAVPAAAIALHGAAEYFGRPQVERLTVSPEILNTRQTPGNPPKTQLNVKATVSQHVDRLKIAFANELGNYTPDLPTTDTVETLDGRDYDKMESFQNPNSTVDGRYYVNVWGEMDNGLVSEKATDTFVVDNTPPAVALQPTTTTVTGAYTLYGLARDENFSRYGLKWSPNGLNDWTTLTVSSSPAPLLSPLHTLDTHALAWNGNIHFQLTAFDAAGNFTTTNTAVATFNDVSTPTISLTGVDPGSAMSNTKLLALEVRDEPPARNTGIVSARLWVESQDNAGKAPLVLLEKTFAPGTTFSLVRANIPLDTFRLLRDSAGEKWRIVAQAVDGYGHVGRQAIADLTIANLLWRFQATPAIFAKGKQTWIQGVFTQSVNWNLSLKKKDGTLLRQFDSTQAGQTGQSFLITWKGDDANGNLVAPGMFRAELRYNSEVTSLPLAIVPALADYRPRVTRLEARSDPQSTNPADVGTSIDLNVASTGSVGRAFIVTGSHPYLKVFGRVSDGLAPFLDGEGPTPDFSAAKPPYPDAFWSLDFKSSLASPTFDDMQVGSKTYDNLTNRTDWHLLAWGNGYGLDSAGAVTAVLDTRSLAERYYDVRLWETDGLGMAHQIVFYLKVCRASTSPETGAPSEVGALTLSATDMSVPLSGMTVEVSRSYNSNDTYAPGALGYGWRLNGIKLDIETLRDQGAGENDEAMIRLPDGRRFFFANNPPEAVNPQDYIWAKFGEYTQRPLGMRLLRPGGSPMYHWPNAVETILPNNSSDSHLELAPGAPGRFAKICYSSPAGRTYLAGEVAYLQTEDKTWYVFEWATGDLLEIIKPDGQVTNFIKQAESDVLIRDSSNREIRIVRDTDGARRIREIRDPAGFSVKYEYDRYGNLTGVSDRSGRRRFYIYDTPESTKLFPGRADLSGFNVHYLVDVRVDDDANGVSRFDQSVSLGSQTTRYLDLIADDPAARLEGSSPQYQNYPGDVSIMKVRYEGGLMKAIETVAGGVALDHQPDAGGLGGQEVVRNSVTGAQTTVAYDDQRRVTSQRDPYGAVTRFSYFAAGDDPTILGALKSETDALGRKTEYTYPDFYQNLQRYSSFSEMFKAYFDSRLGSDSGQPGYMTSGLAGPARITLDAGGAAPSTTDIGYVGNVNDPAFGKPNSIAAPGNNVTGIAYDGQGRIRQVGFTGNGANGASVVNDYYPSGPYAGRLRQTIGKGPGGDALTTTTYGYTDLGGGLERHTVADAASGLATSSVYDAAGRLVSATDARGRTSAFSYDGEGRQISSRDPDGNQSWAAYDVFGRRMRERTFQAGLADGGRPVNVLLYYTYDDAGRLIETVRRKALPDGSDGAILSVARTAYESNSGGRTETVTDDLGRATKTIYDGQGGRLVRTESCAAAGRLLDWTAYQYDALGRTVRTETRRGLISETSYDGLGRQQSTTVSTRDGTYRATTIYTYDAAGRADTITDAQGNATENTYDNLGRLQYVRFNGALVEQIDYDAQGRRAKIWEFKNDTEKFATSYTYDLQSRVTNQWLGYENDSTSHGLHFQFEYDPYGNVARFTNPRAYDRVKQYDARGRLWREFSAATAGKRMVKEYTYDAAGQLTRTGEGTANADLSAVTITRYCALAYDPWRGSVVEKRFSDGRRVRYAYFDNGLLQRVEITSGPADTLIYSRDLRYDPSTWRLAGVTSPEGWIEYEHNDYGQVSRIRTSTGQDTEYVYDQMGNLSLARIRGLTASGGQSVVQYQYYGDTGRRKKVIYPNATTTEYQYDARGGASQIKHTGPSGNLATFDYTRDRRGLIAQMVETRGTGAGQSVATWTYTYDAQKRLRAAQRVKGAETACYGYEYDGAGNRTRQTITGWPTVNYTYNERDQLTADGTTTFVYDDYGNLVEEKEGTTTRRRYSWDGANELVRASLYGAGGTLEHTVGFAYDDQGTRIGRAYDSDVTRYLTDYENPTGYSQTLAELDATATGVRQDYVYGDSLLAQSAPSATQYFHGDHLGSTRLLTDANGNAVVGSDFDHAPYGDLLSGTRSLTPYAFTGQYLDSALNLQYHRARWLNTSTANWLSVDPTFDFPQNFGNAFSYTGGNPINRGDPSGTFSISESAAITAIVGGLNAINLSVGIGLLYHQGGEAADTASMILQLLRHGGIAALCFVPVIGFAVALLRLPDTLSLILAAASAIGAEIGKGDILRAGILFGRMCLSILELVAIGVGAYYLIRGIRVMGAAAFATAEAQAGSTIVRAGSGLSHWQPQFGLRSDPKTFYSYKELYRLIGTTGLRRGSTEGLNAHHLLKRGFAPRMGVAEEDIISVAIVPREHWNYGGGGVNIDNLIETQLTRLGTTGGEASLVQIWQAHRNVYTQIDREEWAEALYRAYFMERGIAY